MLIDLVSDLHLEHHPYTIENRNGADVLVMAGDICQLSSMPLDFFQQCSEGYRDVVYINGNHELYRGDFATSLEWARDELASFPNVHLLEKQTVDIGGITFIGGTLWSDMNREDPITMGAVEDMMNDFRYIRNSNRIIRYDDGSGRPPQPDRFTVRDALDDHYRMMDYTRHVIENNPTGRYVWCVHYGVTHQSIHPKYAAYGATNGGFVSDLSEFILDHPQIELICHGHVHDPFDYKVGDTRVVVNPRGYPRERTGPYYPQTITLP